LNTKQFFKQIRKSLKTAGAGGVAACEILKAAREILKF